VGAPARSLAQPPAPALVDAGDRGPGQIARLAVLDDLDQPADLGGAHPEEDAVARAQPVWLVADHLPARDPGHVVQRPGGIRDEVPYRLRRRGDLDAGL